MKKTIRPEFLNRIDEIIFFHRLTKEDIEKISAIMFSALSKRLYERDITITITDAAKDFIVGQGYNEEYGARPLRRTIQRLVEDKLSEMLLSGEIGGGDKVTIDVDGGALTFKK